MKIRYKVLLLFLLVAMVPLLLSSVWAIYTLRNHQVAATEAQQEAVSQIVSDKVLAFIRAKAEKFVIQIIQPTLDPISLEQQRFVLQDIIKRDVDVVSAAIFDFNGYESMTIDANGNVSLQNENLASKEIFRTVMAGEVYLDEVQHLIGAKTLAMGLPIFNSQKQIVAGLRLVISLDSIDTLLANLMLDDDTVVYVLDKYLKVVSYSPNINQQAISDLPLVQNVDNFNTAINQEKSSIGALGVPIAISARKINDLNWWVIVEQPNIGFQQFLNPYSTQIFLIFLISLLLVAVISLIFTNRISNPINKLIEGSQVISKGNFKYRIKIPTNDEIELLGNEFNSMAESLEKICPTDNLQNK